MQAGSLKNLTLSLPLLLEQFIIPQVTILHTRTTVHVAWLFINMPMFISCHGDEKRSIEYGFDNKLWKTSPCHCNHL